MNTTAEHLGVTAGLATHDCGNCGNALYRHGFDGPCKGCIEFSKWEAPAQVDALAEVKGKACALATQVAGSHYKDMPIQPAEFIHKNGIEFLPGCVIKRMCRWRKKDGLQDLRKAIHEIELMIEMEATNSSPSTTPC